MHTESSFEKDDNQGVEMLVVDDNLIASIADKVPEELERLKEKDPRIDAGSVVDRLIRKKGVAVDQRKDLHDMVMDRLLGRKLHDWETRGEKSEGEPSLFGSEDPDSSGDEKPIVDPLEEAERKQARNAERLPNYYKTDELNYNGSPNMEDASDELLERD